MLITESDCFNEYNRWIVQSMNQLSVQSMIWSINKSINQSSNQYINKNKLINQSTKTHLHSAIRCKGLVISPEIVSLMSMLLYLLLCLFYGHKGTTTVCTKCYKTKKIIYSTQLTLQSDCVDCWLCLYHLWMRQQLHTVHQQQQQRRQHEELSLHLDCHQTTTASHL